MNNLNDNIIFCLEEKRECINKDNSYEIEKLLYELENGMEEVKEPSYLLYFYKKNKCDEKFGINNTFFYEEYTVKQLLKICDYYDIEKTVKMAKYKKQDIIESIVYFESLPENIRIVNDRHKMWAYIMELTNDQKMKKYVIWQ